MSINKQKNKTFTKSYPKQFIFKNCNLWNFPNYNQFPKLVKISGKSEIVGYKFNFFFLWMVDGGGVDLRWNYPTGFGVGQGKLL